jgi:hypothetical protein
MCGCVIAPRFREGSAYRIPNACYSAQDINCNPYVGMKTRDPDHRGPSLSVASDEDNSDARVRRAPLVHDHSSVDVDDGAPIQARLGRYEGEFRDPNSFTLADEVRISHGRVPRRLIVETGCTDFLERFPPGAELAHQVGKLITAHVFIGLRVAAVTAAAGGAVHRVVGVHNVSSNGNSTALRIDHAHLRVRN